MNKAQLMIRFMRAVIRGRDGCCLPALSEADLFEAFNTLPEPSVVFEEWCARSGIDLSAIQAAEQRAINEGMINVFVAQKAAGAPIDIGAPIEVKQAPAGA